MDAYQTALSVKALVMEWSSANEDTTSSRGEMRRSVVLSRTGLPDKYSGQADRDRTGSAKVLSS